MSESVPRGTSYPREGFVPGMPEPLYHYGGPKDELSFHLAMTLLHTPAHLRYAIDHPDDRDSAIKKFGRAVHAALLQPDRYDDLVTIMPEGKERRGNWWKKFSADHAGTDILSFAEGEAVEDIRLRVRAHPLARVLLDPGTAQTEVSYFWTDPDTGVRCRARADVLNEAHHMAIDVKKVTSCDARTIGRRFADFKYHAQQAWYGDGLLELGWPLDTFVFLCIEGEFPHTVRLVTCKDVDVDAGRQANLIARRRFAECLETDEWGAWPEVVEVVDMPPWGNSYPA